MSKFIKKVGKAFTIHNVVLSLRKKGKTRWFDCECGKKFSVTTNVYDNSDSGCGSCECGKSRVYIN